jgi:hypothetical protein
MSSFESDRIDITKLGSSDFYFGKCLGEGAYARVVHGKMKRNDHEFAIKVMEKSFIKKENKVYSMLLIWWLLLFNLFYIRLNM